MADHFPKGQIIFDTISKIAVRITERRIKKYIKQGKLKSDEVPHWIFSVGNPNKVFPKWSNKIKVLDWHLGWDLVPRNPNWDKKTLKMIKLVKLFKTGKIVLLGFND
jgi:hypothetical protein